jgi:hypothetical protein
MGWCLILIFMTATDEKYVEILKAVLQSEKVWERNDLLSAFKKALAKKKTAKK